MLQIPKTSNTGIYIVNQMCQQSGLLPKTHAISIIGVLAMSNLMTNRNNYFCNHIQGTKASNPSVNVVNANKPMNNFLFF
jgi:hypothetical protein